MISIIISFFPLVLIFYYFVVLRSKISNYANSLVLKKSGKSCYKCNEKNAFEEIQYKLHLCRSCEREISVDNIINPCLSIKYRFCKFIFTKNFEKIQSTFLYLTIFVMFLNVILVFFEINITPIPTSILLSLYWILLIYRTKIVIEGF